MVLGIGKGELAHVIVHFLKVMLLQGFLFHGAMTLRPLIVHSCRSELVDRATRLFGIFLYVYRMLKDGFSLLHHLSYKTSRSERVIALHPVEITISKCQHLCIRNTLY